MEGGERKRLFLIVDRIRLGDEEWLSRLRNPYELAFANHARERLDFLQKKGFDKRFYWHGFPVIAPQFPPLGSDIEKNHLVYTFLNRNKSLVQGSITVAISYNCNSYCKQCYISEYVDPEKKELSVPEFKLLFEKIVNELGVWHIDLTGGEPLEHPDFFDIIDQVPKDRATVILATNGMHINKDVVKRIRESNIMVCKVSLGSYLRSGSSGVVRDSFDKAIKGIKLLLENKICTFVQIYVERGCHTTNELESLVLRCKELGAAGVHLITPLTVGNLKGRYDLMLGFEDRKHLYALQSKYRSPGFFVVVFPDWELELKQSGRGCLAGRGRIYITPYGNVFPCNMHCSKSYGNILRDDVKLMMKKMHADIPDYPETCFSSDVTLDTIQAIKQSIKTRNCQIC